MNVMSEVTQHKWDRRLRLFWIAPVFHIWQEGWRIRMRDTPTSVYGA